MREKEMNELKVYFLKHPDEFLNYCDKNNKFKLHFYQKMHLRVLSKISNKCYSLVFGGRQHRPNELELMNKFSKIILKNKDF